MGPPPNRIVRLWLLWICAAIGINVPLGATMIVVIFTPDGYWIGADSSRTDGGKRVETVCKIHSTKFGLLAKFGDSQGLSFAGTFYSTDKEVEDLIDESLDAEAFKTKLRWRGEADIMAELAYDTNGQATPQEVGKALFALPLDDTLSTILARGDILFTPNHGFGEVLMMRPVSNRVTVRPFAEVRYRYSVEDDEYWTPLETLPTIAIGGEDNRKITLLPSVRMFAYMVPSHESDAWVQSHPKEALTKYFDQGHTEAPEDIGPPYTLVHVIRQQSREDKIDWIEKGACPGWTEDILPVEQRMLNPSVLHP